MRYSLGMTVVSGWDYPHPVFSHTPTADERRPLLTWARSVGFDGIDLADTWMNWLTMSESELREVRDQVHEAGLEISGLNPYRCILVRHETAATNEEKLVQTIEARARSTAVTSTWRSRSRFRPSGASASGRSVSYISRVTGITATSTIAGR